MPLAPSLMPTTLVILGITGDLARKKILPALFHLYERGALPPLFQIVGFGRRPWSDPDVRAYVAKAIRENHHPVRGQTVPDETQLSSFLERVTYERGVFEDASGYDALAARLQRTDDGWRVCSNKLFYLSVPPKNYETILRHLQKAGLTIPCGPDEGWTRVLVEKPFGKDAETANNLDRLLDDLFQEEQIYRIDHYLAKEMVQNILTFRFSNDLFEQTWNSRFVESIDIRVWEMEGIEGRENFYDGIGALRDVGQNHLLQMLAFVTMDAPDVWDADSIRLQRARLLETLIPLRERDVTVHAIRAQYDGYRTLDGVAHDSNTETFFRVQFFLNHPRWRDIPIRMESGKHLGAQKKEIVVTFRHNPSCRCPDGVHHRNRIIFSLEPNDRIEVAFWAKKPGMTYDLQPRKLSFSLRDVPDEGTGYAEEYERLLLDAMVGDQTLFVSSAEVQAMWNFIDPIILAWEHDAAPLHSYAPGSTHPAPDTPLSEDTKI